MRGLIKSFGYAFSGFAKAVKNERNLKIHLSVASLIIAFAYFFGLTRTEWAILFLAIGFVIASELFNTSVEWCADAVTRTENDDIKHAKDIAAAGVTVSAMISITVGFALFADIERIAGTLKYILGNISAIIVFAVIILADILLLTLVKETKQDRNLKGTK